MSQQLLAQETEQGVVQLIGTLQLELVKTQTKAHLLEIEVKQKNNKIEQLEQKLSKKENKPKESLTESK